MLFLCPIIIESLNHMVCNDELDIIPIATHVNVCYASFYGFTCFYFSFIITTCTRLNTIHAQIIVQIE